MNLSDYNFTLGKVKYITKTGLRNMLKLPQYNLIKQEKKDEIVQSIGYQYKWTDAQYVKLAHTIMKNMYQDKELDEQQALCVITTILNDLLRYSILQIDIKPKKQRKRGGQWVVFCMGLQYIIK